MEWINYLEQQTDYLITDLGISAEWAIYCRMLIFLVLLFVLSFLALFITKKFIIRNLYKLFRMTTYTWDDLIIANKVLENLAQLVPAIILRILIPIIFRDFSFILPFLTKLTDIFLIIVSVKVLISIIRVGEQSLSRHPAFLDKPLSSYFQLFRLIAYIISFILILSILLGKSPIYFLSAFGAMTAILLLIFKDTILGLVASVQMSSNDMIRVGDWVEMPKFNADGNVIDINLNIVKVQNFDNTITVIPTYYFISDSFKNWRGMQQSGGRRIKRALHIDVNSVKLVTPEMREKFRNYQLIENYIETRHKEIEDFNTKNNIDTSILINGRRMTNIGVFRKYIEQYLHKHPRVRKDMTIMVRQLANENRGIPLEVYCFTDTTIWNEYEAIQSDIFDHLYSTAVFFELDIFQEPTGYFRNILNT